MCPQKVTLTWDGHYQTVMSVFEKLLANTTLIDCTLVTEGRQVKAHKEVLAAFSPYFQMLLEEEKYEQSPLLILPEFSFKEVSSLIDYMYFGQVQVAEDSVENLIDAARSLQIKGLGDGYEKESSQFKSLQFKGSGDPINTLSSPHKRRKISTGKECGSFSSVETVQRNPNHCQTQSIVHNLQQFGVAVVPITRDKTGISSSFGLNSSDTKNELTRPEQTVLPTEEHGAPSHNITVPFPKTVTRIDPCANYEILTPENESIFERNEEEESEDISMPIASYKAHYHNESLVTIPTNSMGTGHRSSEFLPLQQSVSGFPSALPADLASTVNALNNGHVIESCTRNQQSKGFSLPEDPLADADMFLTSGLIQKTKSIMRNENVIEKTSENQEPLEIKIEDTESIGEEDNFIDYSGAECITEEQLYESQPLESCSEKYLTCVTNYLRPTVDSRLERSHSSRCSQKTSTCPVCNKTFKTLYILRVHMRSHTGEKPFKCLCCDYSTAYQGDIKKHMRNHTGEKSFKCPECAYSTVWSGNMTRHMRIHTGE